MSETAVERRLREMGERRRKVAAGRVEASWLPEYERLTRAIDAGREAIALLRVLLTLSELDYGDMSLFYADEPEHPVTRAAALLARCEGES